MQSLSAGMFSGVACSGRPAARQAARPPSSRAGLQAQCLQVDGRAGRQRRLVGDQHQRAVSHRPGPAPGAAVSTSACRRYGFCAKLHAGAQVDGADAAVGQAGHQRLRAGGGQRGQGHGCGGGQGQAAGQALVQHAGVVAQLAQPARHRERAHAVVVEQHQPGPAHADVLVGGLDQLAAGRVLRAGQAAVARIPRGCARRTETACAARRRPSRCTVCASTTGTLKRSARAWAAARMSAARRAGPIRDSGACRRARVSGRPGTSPGCRFRAPTRGCAGPG